LNFPTKKWYHRYVRTKYRCISAHGRSSSIEQLSLDNWIAREATPFSVDSPRTFNGAVDKLVFDGKDVVIVAAASALSFLLVMARMTGLKADLDRQRTRVAALRREIVGTALSDYHSSGGLSTSASFLVAKRPSEFINALAPTPGGGDQPASTLRTT